MKPAIRMVLKERAPLEARREELQSEIDILDSMLDEIGKPNATNAAVFLIRKKPGLSTSEIVKASGIDITALSRLGRWGVIRHDGQHGRSGESRWYPRTSDTSSTPRSGE